MSGIKVDISGAVKKTQALLNIPKATRYQMDRFGQETKKSLQRSALNMKKSAKYHTLTRSLSRSIGFKLTPLGETMRLTIGTGLGGTPLANTMAERYAKIQDKGGVTHPTVTPRMRKWAWYMFYRYKESKFKGIALTKKSKLTVRIPASGWFTGPWEHKLAFLKTSYLNDRVILDTAKRFGGGHAR